MSYKTTFLENQSLSKPLFNKLPAVNNKINILDDMLKEGAAFVPKHHITETGELPSLKPGGFRKNPTGLTTFQKKFPEQGTSSIFNKPLGDYL